jgi:HD-GYP domain-containing protein (c-di-GMP phosphodiesterase class II)
VLSRIIGISDKFETLTSAGKSHKKGKTLSEVITYMDALRNDKHIDSELFEIFLSSGIYMDYAKRHMEPYQIDEVDISKYVKYN